MHFHSQIGQVEVRQAKAVDGRCGHQVKSFFLHITMYNILWSAFTIQVQYKYKMIIFAILSHEWFNQSKLNS